ncbi:MAG: 50S ribosomal protein L3 [Elusimicrobiaceae bacterium]|jgi:large subunit ribosomal protein L3|nr:50S ribosomal protein L3 [Elusimicrobiaceae bacterium]MBT6921387.1 50S ribosomal protein L3 [Candidatus Paceibacterota bacterium]MBT3955105.1 50S ribosomal protein L3 [Elusimicrobiaceae bacterium]MBT4007722.1 50S ribosomal protein L3 [Elusimicrobiaceae bacterium]MBT4403411.1 50S ribosomal protein L3 [Elusimicrobiaceae bacterium]
MTDEQKKAVEATSEDKKVETPKVEEVKEEAKTETVKKPEGEAKEEVKAEPVEEKSKEAPETLKVILGKKIGMTQLFDENGNLYATSVVEAGPCSVVRLRTKKKDGYNAVCLGFGKVEKEKNLNKPDKGYFEKNKLTPVKHMKEYRTEQLEGFELGQDVTVGFRFKEGDIVDVQGKSKGHGFTGVMKRYNFKGLPATHGTKHKARSPGSIASRRSLGRVIPGQKMPGRMGNEIITVQRIQVTKVDAENNLIYLNGSVPGARGTVVSILTTSKKRNSDNKPKDTKKGKKK